MFMFVSIVIVYLSKKSIVIVNIDFMVGIAHGCWFRVYRTALNFVYHGACHYYFGCFSQHLV